MQPKHRFSLKSPSSCGSRVNPHTCRTKKLSFDRKVCRATALELGSLFKLEPTPNKGQSFKRGDIERYKRTSIHPRTVKRDITHLWNSAKSGKGFAASLNDYGYVLALGKRGQFVLVDQAGSVHGLARRIEGGTAKTIKRGLSDIDRATIPTIAEAKRLIKGKASGTKGTSTTGSAGSRSARYAALVGPIDPSSITYRKSKSGKSDGESGMVSAASVFKFSAKETIPPLRWMPERPKHQNGPNRRYQNIWVPVERRECKL
jgi:hypothetical protein